MGATLKYYRMDAYERGSESAFEGAKYKSRLVAQKFTDQPSKTFPPTPTLQSVRAMLNMACENKWEIKLAAVSTAFLHGPVVEPTFVAPAKCLSLSKDAC